MVSIDDIRAAAERVGPVLRKTPIEHVHAVSRAVNRDVWVKEEQLQRTGSYKIRGAFNFIASLPPGTVAVAASEGNHAQGVALAASLAGYQCEIFMPKRASLPRLEATEGYGANLVLVDGDLAECQVRAQRACAEDGKTFVPAYDHELIIAGQGTVGLELAAEMPPEIETVVVPVGGGGLISGVAVALKTLRPDVRIVGVEAAGAPAMSRSLRSGRPVYLDRMLTIADGIAMRTVSELTLQHVREYVDEVVLVTEAEISHALLVLIERAKAVIEPGAAASLAAVLSGEVAGKGSVCAVLSGGNVDPVLLMKLIDQGLTSSGRFAIMRVNCSDNPGQLAEMARVISDMGLNVVDIEHHRSGLHLEANQVQVELTLETRNRTQQDEVITALESFGFRAEIIE